MTTQPSEQEEKMMIEKNIKEFLAAARAYLLELMPAPEPRLATIPVRNGDRR
jgi:hypothetical protein